MKKNHHQTTFNPVDIVLRTNEDTDHKILQLLAEAPISIRREPEVGMVMMTVTDDAGTNFHLGEVLVTEAEIEYEGKTSYAMVVGSCPEKALARAAVKAVMEGKDNVLKTRLGKYLATQAGSIEKKEQIDENLHASTIVNFETMTQW